ncbi:nucleoside recognition membrane protein YjiH [Alkalihalobacillus xiaoxiensis]|uniref:Nucleoside recognition membrane protein YjiH n=1 Tax=Shouchella xiaoxiensis TaxID=766895 RepID=A0ABS2SQQ9_9BACI|nr:YjiH family protein [Shouchella xiaoxiensis]MBM7836859.1 nucleoside recognition membrane protein YjiH [Shouchella xiaoxiensis]
MNQEDTPINQTKGPKKNATLAMAKFLFFSLFGIFMFFVPITISDRSSIPLDHFVTLFRQAESAVYVYIFIILLLGAVYPFYTKKWNKSATDLVLSIFKILGFISGALILFGIGPAWLFAPDMGPFLLNSLITPVSLLVPIGALFLTVLIGYGLLEFLGNMMEPIMRPIFKTPGRSSLDAIASFVGSYSVGLLVTNSLYKQGIYSFREASIIATGFSTVSVTFMVVIANTLDLMSIWTTYFIVSFIVTFAVTAITARIWPLSTMKDDYYPGSEPQKEALQKLGFSTRMKKAWNEAIDTAATNRSFFKEAFKSLKEGLVMTMSILPTIMSIGLLGLVLATYTPVFDFAGYLFYPLTALLQLPDPMLAAKAAAISISEIFLPALLVVEADIVTRFIIAVMSVSSVLFFSAVIPCILATDIKLSIGKMVIVWFIRVVLTLILVTPIAFLLF